MTPRAAAARRKCGHLSLSTDKTWLSGYDRCGACGFKTVETRTEAVAPAMDCAEGIDRIVETCLHCGKTTTRTKRLPRLEHSDGHEHHHDHHHRH